MRTTSPTEPAKGGGHPSGWLTGRLLSGGAYEVRKHLGKGGMGDVYEAYDHALGRVVALKTVLPGVDPARLRKEALALGACRHPGVVTVHAFVVDEGVEFLVMERVYGVSLAELVAQRTRSDSPLTIPEVLDLLIGLTEAVGAVHEAGISHRDLKPDNVLVAPGGRVVVIDFGIFAPEFAADDTGPLSGTPDYMAPEVIRESVRPGGGHLADLYAIGVIGFELLTGRPPFSGSVMEVLTQHAFEEPPSVQSLRPNTPPALAAFITELLGKSEQERPGTAQEVLWRLRSLRGDSPSRRGRGQLSVLVVDDDPNARLLASHILRRLSPDMEIVSASDGVSAVREATRNPPDLMLLDLDLPGMNGLEVCLALRGTRVAERTAIVLVSGRARSPDRVLLRQLGVEHFVDKGPGLGRGLVAAIEALRARKDGHGVR